MEVLRSVWIVGLVAILATGCTEEPLPLEKTIFDPETNVEGLVTVTSITYESEPMDQYKATVLFSFDWSQVQQPSMVDGFRIYFDDMPGVIDIAADPLKNNYQFARKFPLGTEPCTQLVTLFLDLESRKFDVTCLDHP